MLLILIFMYIVMNMSREVVRIAKMIKQGLMPSKKL